MKWMSIVGVILLSGCTTIAGIENPEKTSYVMVSTGEASLVYKALVGGVEYCKVSQNNLLGVVFDGEIEWDGEKCVVTIVAGDNNAVQ